VRINHLVSFSTQHHITQIMQSLTKHIEEQRNEKARKNIVLRNVIVEGAKAGTLASFLAGAGTFLAARWYPSFRQSMPLSGKSAIILMAGLGTFALRAELLLNSYARGEVVVGVPSPSQEEIQEEAKKQAFDLHLRAANFFYRYVFTSCEYKQRRNLLFW